jgi:YYY domain-containing protein
MVETSVENVEPQEPKRISRLWIYDLIVVLVLVAAALLRFNGLFWGEYQFLHPDERFLIWVGTDISPVKSLAEYFDTANSTLNPHNRGHGFYVYGTLPMFAARYLVEWVLGQTGWQEMTQMGRLLSSLADLGMVLLVYLVGRRLYGRRVGTLAVAFAAAVVLQIQQAHYFTMDTFAAFFTFLAFYFAVVIATAHPPEAGVEEAGAQFEAQAPGAQTEGAQAARSYTGNVLKPVLWPCLAFGVALGMAVASKVNAVPVAVVLPGAMLIYLARLKGPRRQETYLRAFLYLVLAALISLLVFRLLQPYAFSGPGFFGLKLNPLWLQNMKEQRAQAGAEVDFPPAMQWARRPLWFSFQNMVIWGLGLPLGLLAWAGFLWVGWRLLTVYRKDREQWYSHILIWGWTAVYFAWQSIQLNPTMRYQLPIYPTLVIFAAWAVFALWDKGMQAAATAPGRARGWKTAAVLVGGLVLVATYAYAIAFTQLYSRPITRVAASRWIYQNIPGPISLPIQTEDGTVNQSLPFPYGQRITPTTPFTTSFVPKVGGTLSEVTLPRVKDDLGLHEVITLTLTIAPMAEPEAPPATAMLVEDFTPDEDPRGRSYTLQLDQSIQLDPLQTYVLGLAVESPPAFSLAGPVQAIIEPMNGEPQVQELSAAVDEVPANTPLYLEMQAGVDGDLTQLRLHQAPSAAGAFMPTAYSLTVEAIGGAGGSGSADPVSGEQTFTELIPQEGGTEGEIVLNLAQPVPLYQGLSYRLILNISPSGGSLALSGLGVANEGEWDDGLPLRMDGYDGFGGIYPTELNFNMYWDDNRDKLERFLGILDKADYIVISSNRQWGTLPRLPERFPLTTLYYRSLLGCPAESDIVDCYRVAEPGLYQGELGFDLVQVFTSEPRLGPLRLNDQFAEEAFTVYDHPKVLVFQKNQSYDSQKVRDRLSSVDLSQVIRVAPMKAPAHPSTLLLPEERWSEQQAGGTWSELFDPAAPQNRYPMLSILLWYLTVGLLGGVTYPLLRLALPGLEDRGYPLARAAGMLLLSYLTWLAGSARIPVSRTTIGLLFLALALVGAFLAYRQRSGLAAELRQKRNYFLVIEGLALAFFLAFLLVRLGNPDLWHPWKGGEKPMDFSYFNAILKSTSFPPYDPWYAGGYLNYYYYGYVLVGTLVKLLGITPSVAYNLILPTLFSLIALGAFSIVWNLASRATARRAGSQSGRISPYLPALFGAFAMAVLGNLGTVRMFYQGLQRLVAPAGNLEDASLISRWIWTVQGFGKALLGAQLPYGTGDWYWLPSRAIPALGDVEPITEFPYFSVLYADLHAHLIALPLTLLALAFCVGFVLGKGRWKSVWGGIAWFGLAALSIGALRPTNTWDMPTYLALGIVAIVYTVARYYRKPQQLRFAPLNELITNLPESAHSLLAALGGAALLTGLAFLLYKPYADWYALGYTQIRLWEGTRTQLYSYLIHWGVFLFLIISWLVWETRDWLARTPLSRLRRLAPYRLLIQVGITGLLLLSLGLTFFGFFAGLLKPNLQEVVISIAWFVLPLATWAGLLLLRPDMPDAKRIVFFLVGTGLVLTLMVELIVLVGDIGRMNTVFKFYLQVWTFFSIAAAAGLGWLLPALPDWRPAWRVVWNLVLVVLVAGAALYPLWATTAKIRDRMAANAPQTLDGMAYMQSATYADEWGVMDLSQDYRAIRWMQQNVSGTPVIVEANLRNLYRWGSRFSIYTGLPGVVGWEWHQQQQRAVNPAAWVTQRIQEVDQFYHTTDLKAARDFLRKYNVRYIILGQQERGHYPGPGLDKFEDADGSLWREVYRDGETVIYEVLDN